MKAASTKNSLTPARRAELIAVLQARFASHPERHAGLTWDRVLTRLEARPQKIRSLRAMEETGGEPDAVGEDGRSGEILFVDCAPQSPAGRTSLCYDRAALDARKEHKPKNCATDLAAELGVELLDEEEYLALQRLGEFDTKSSSWLRTPADIRARGGAIFGDRRFGRVFIYHNGAESYYSGRGFRGMLRV